MFLSYLLVGDYDGLLIEYECYSPMNQLEQAQTIHLSDMFHLSCRRYNPICNCEGPYICNGLLLRDEWKLSILRRYWGC